MLKKIWRWLWPLDELPCEHNWEQIKEISRQEFCWELDKVRTVGYEFVYRCTKCGKFNSYSTGRK